MKQQPNSRDENMSKEQSKEELVEQIHALLGIELKTLNRMSKEDLLKLRDILADPANLVQVAVRSKKPVLKNIEELVSNPLKGLKLLLELGEENEPKPKT